MLNGQQFPQQLPMFMQAGEIKRSTYPVDRDSYPSTAAMWAAKKNEAKNERGSFLPGGVREGSLYDSIRANGVRAPLHMGAEPTFRNNEHGQPEMLGGHHRIASSDDRDEIPVVWHQSWHDMNTSWGYGYT